MKTIEKISSMMRKKQFVFILSTMRSGSTLLKSLLAVPQEVSHLPEVPFHKYRFFPELRLRMLAKERVIVLKKPSWIGEVDYPRLPRLSESKKIVLIRHPYETITSILDMNDQVSLDKKQNWSKEELLQYWNETYTNLYQMHNSADSVLLRYESLVKSPKEKTGEIFNFIGLKNCEGVDTYFPPQDYEWQWFNDDGGEKIKSLRVQPKAINRPDIDLLKMIEDDTKTSWLLHQFGYDVSI